MLNLDARRAEIDRGCTWADRFRSQTSVESYGGTVTGSPSFEYDGVTLSGSAQSISYSINNVISGSEVSVEIIFTPDFDVAEDAIRYLYDTDVAGTSRCTALKQNNANSNELQVAIGGRVVQVAQAAYQQYWFTGRRNSLVVVGDASAGIYVWMNGILIGNSAGSFTVADYSTLHVGMRYNSSGYFDGKINSMRLYGTILTDLEAVQISSNAVANPMNSASHYWPMSSTSLLTDVVGSADLTTVGSPSKISGQRGYDLDGAADYLETSSVPVLPPDNGISIACLFSIGPHDGSSVSHYYSSAYQTIFSNAYYSGNQIGIQVRALNNGNMYFGSGQTGSSSTISTGINPCPGIHFVGVCYYSGQIWMVFDDSTYGSIAGYYEDPSRDLQFGHNLINAADSFHFGGIHTAAVWRSALTPIQLLDVRDQWIRSLNND